SSKDKVKSLLSCVRRGPDRCSRRRDLRVQSSSQNQNQSQHRTSPRLRPRPLLPALIVQADPTASRALRVASRWPTATLDPAVPTLDLASMIGLREFGYSWTEIGDRLGISRQAARQRWTTTPD